MERKSKKKKRGKIEKGKEWRGEEEGEKKRGTKTIPVDAEAVMTLVLRGLRKRVVVLRV